MYNRIRLILMAVGCLSVCWGGASTYAAGVNGTVCAASPDGDEYNPDNPAEPATLEYCYLTVTADPSEGAYVSGAGKYNVDKGNVYISTSAKNTNYYTYTFKYWTLNGEQYTTSQNFYYTPVKGKSQFVACYEKKDVVYDPSDPAEPTTSTIKKKYYLFLTSNLENACSFNRASGDKYEQGTSVYLSVNPNPYFQFDGWKVNGAIVSTSNGFYYTMPSSDITVEAIFTELEYNPDSPIDPSGSSQTDVDSGNDPDRLLVNLTIGHADSASVDKTRIVFNDSKSLEYEIGTDNSKTISTTAAYQIYSYDADDVKYSINERPVDNGSVPLAIIVKTAGQVEIAATRLDCNAYLIDKTLNVEHNLADGAYTFSSATGTFTDRFELYVPVAYVSGDVTGDGLVNVTDLTTLVNYIMSGTRPATRTFKASDVNSDWKLNVTDLTTIVNIIMNSL